jgi:hypothetical protein
MRLVTRLVVVLGLATMTALAQAQKQEGARLALAAVGGKPGGRVMVPLLLTPEPAESKVGRVSAAISFDTKVVAFGKAEEGFLLDGVGAKFTAKAEKGAAGRDRVRVEVFTEGSSRQALREGLLLTLVFQIEAHARPGSIATLEFETKEAFGLSEPPNTVSVLAAENGSIEVVAAEEMPAVSCFFFTH